MTLCAPSLCRVKRCFPCCAGSRLNAQAAVLNAVEMSRDCARERPAIATARLRCVSLKQSSRLRCGVTVSSKWLWRTKPC